MPGLFSVQAVGKTDACPDITYYRQDLESAMKVKDHLVKRKSFRHFLLRDLKDQWDVYDEYGRLADRTKKVASPQDHVGEVKENVSVDSKLLLQEARIAARNSGLSLLSYFDHHLGSSAARQSNFLILCRRMLIESDKKDMQHFCFVDSKQFACRTSGLYADVSKLSPAMQDVYLDRYKWLENGWPLVANHHRDMLAGRLTKIRSHYVLEIIEEAGRAAGMDTNATLAMKSSWSLASPGAKQAFALHLISMLREGLVFDSDGPETFDHGIVQKHSRLIMESEALLRG